MVSRRRRFPILDRPAPLLDRFRSGSDEKRFLSTTEFQITEGRGRGRPPERPLPRKFQPLARTREDLFPPRSEVRFFRQGAGGRCNEGNLLHALMSETLQRDFGTTSLPKPIKDLSSVSNDAVKEAFDARARWFGLPEVDDQMVSAVMDEAGFVRTPPFPAPITDQTRWVRRTV